MSVSVAFDRNGNAHYAAIWSDGKVNYKPPGGSWRACDMTQSGAKSGTGIDVRDDDFVIISYTNGAGAACAYTKTPGEDFVWNGIGGSVR